MIAVFYEYTGTRLNQDFMYYTIKFAQSIHNAIPVKDLNDKYGFPTTPYEMETRRKPAEEHFKVFGCPAIFYKM